MENFVEDKYVISIQLGGYKALEIIFQMESIGKRFIYQHLMIGELISKKNLSEVKKN